MNQVLNINDAINNDNFINIYLFGSRVYGTYTNSSDYDYICIVGEKTDSLLCDQDGNHYHLFTENEFKFALDEHDIQMLECYFLPKKYIIKENKKFNINIDRIKLRKSISTITSKSWVKGHKKLVITGDYDKYLAIKSIFHSLRILDFGIQICIDGKINNYSNVNYIMDDINKLAEKSDRNELWDLINTKYKGVYNTFSSNFKKMCPKDNNELLKIDEIRNLLQLYNVKDDNNELLNELLNIIK